MKSSGPEPLRVLAVTSDASVLHSLRQDGRVVVLAHVEDPVLASQFAVNAAVDAILIDDHRVAPFLADHNRRQGGGDPKVYVLRSSLVDTSSSVPASPESFELRSGLGPAQPATLREWWLAGETGRATEASLSPSVLMRQVIAVVSPKGGVGKTFVSVNLSVCLARQTGFQVLLLDLDLHSGDAAVHLDLIGKATLADLVPYAGNLEAGHLERGVVSHVPSRLCVLLAPPRPEAAELVAREHLGDLLKVVRQRYDFVVIDTPPDASQPLVSECLKEASSVVLVTSLDAAALRQCRLFLDGFRASDSEALKKFRVVLNQAHDRGPLSPERAAAFLGTSLSSQDTAPAFVIPEDRAAVERCVYDGRPLTLSEPSHPVSKAIFALAHSFCPVFGPLLGPPARKRPGLRGLVEVLRRW